MNSMMSRGPPGPPGGPGGTWGPSRPAKQRRGGGGGGGGGGGVKEGGVVQEGKGHRWSLKTGGRKLKPSLEA